MSFIPIFFVFRRFSLGLVVDSYGACCILGTLNGARRREAFRDALLEKGLVPPRSENCWRPRPDSPFCPLAYAHGAAHWRAQVMHDPGYVMSLICGTRNSPSRRAVGDGDFDRGDAESYNGHCFADALSRSGSAPALTPQLEVKGLFLGMIDALSASAFTTA